MPARVVTLHEEGPALWPKHKPLDEVMSLKAVTPELVWEATYQGNPKAPSGSIFKRSWWAEGVNRFDWANHRIALQAVARWVSFDTAMKDLETSAFSTGLVFDLMPDYTVCLRDLWRDRIPFPELAPTIESVARRNNHDGKLRGIIIEEKASGISVIQTIRNAVTYDWMSEMITAYTPTVSKDVRATQASVWCRNGMIKLPHPGPDWLFDFEDELFGYPNSTYADQVDAFSQAVIFLELLLTEGFQLRAGNRLPTPAYGEELEDGY